jgi:hypothetical protein
LCVRHQYGKGIYFASHAGTSLGYCARGSVSNWPKSQFGHYLQCLALCEVVDDQPNFTYFPGKSGARNPGNFNCGIFVVPQEEYVTTRFFIVQPQSGLTLDSQKLVKDAIQQGKLTFLADHGNNEDGDGDVAMEGGV